MSFLILRHRIGLGLLTLVGLLPTTGWSAATNYFIPVADTSLLEVSPNNNLGGFAGMNAGTTQNFPRTRALFRFDLTSLPPNTVVQSAAVTLIVTRQPMDGYALTPFGLRRMLRPWGEGDKNPASQPGQGSPASAGEATWSHAFFPTNAWTVPGGQIGVDFSSTESSFQSVYDVANSPYRFESTPEMVDDVTSWLHSPATNFGWMLLCGDESNIFTARRFGSREDPNAPPILELQYVIPPALQLTKTNATQVQLHFPAWADHHYDVFYRNSLSTGGWLTLTNLAAAPTNYAALVIDSASNTQRFYRISAY